MTWVEMLITIFGSVMASSGFWAFFSTVNRKQRSEDLILRGIAHYSIISEGQRYIRRGWITNEEYDDFMKYLGQPYLEMGANGLAQKIIEKVGELPFRQVSDLTNFEKGETIV